MAEDSKYQDRDFSNDELPPEFIKQHLLAHDKRMREGRKGWALAKACYTTNYWKHIRTTGQTSRKEYSKQTDIDIEVNRLWGIVSSYLSALYPRASRAVITPDPAGRGDPKKAELALNRWLSSNRIHKRILTGIRQSILYPGCGAKIGYYPGRGNPLDRVWMRVIPWWEMLLDYDVGDTEDERFRGHIYYRPKTEVEEEYGLKNLTGTSRDDFLEGSYRSGEKRNYKNPTRKQADSDNSAFVRVLELCNMRDNFSDSKNPNIVYEGRLEIYILGQGKLSQKPVWMGPLPFAGVDGDPLPHIVPLIFNHEPEFPLRGLSHSARVLPQIKEMNAYRSFMAMSSRKDTRQYVTRKGTFGADELTDLTEGNDGLILQLDKDYDRPLGDAIVPIMNAPISANIDRYMDLVAQDLERNIGMSPAARGIVTKATAFEVQAVQQYTESDFGMHASIKDEWLVGLLTVVLRALISCMQDLGDSAGAYDGQEVALAEVGALPTGEGVAVDGEDQEEQGESEEGRDQSEMAKEQREDSEQEPFVSTDSLEFKEDEVEETKIEPEKLVLRDRREFVEVIVEDLDAAFDVTFVEGGGAPMDDVAKQQNLLGLLEPYTSLWGLVIEGGPNSAMARAYMKALVEKFELPKDLHPDELEARMQEEAEQAAESDDQAMVQATEVADQPMGQPQGMTPVAPQPQAQAQPSPDLSQLLQMPPDQAILALREVFAADPEMQQMLDQLQAMPPEQQAEMIASMVSASGEPVATV
tara:strand:+ start:2614 stop:4872 length:2259 start_codon:yes stop_codon:yes gene_type:complete